MSLSDFEKVLGKAWLSCASCSLVFKILWPWMWSLDAFVSESFQKNLSEVYLIFPILKACEFFLILIVSPCKERHPHDFLMQSSLSALGSDPGAGLEELQPQPYCDCGRVTVTWSGTSVRNPPASSGDLRGAASVPGSGRSWRRTWRPTRVLAWRIPWTEESMGLQRAGHDFVHMRMRTHRYSRI